MTYICTYCDINIHDIGHRKFHIVAALDCYEIKKEKPFNLLAKGSTWSQYKQSNTVIILIAIAPQGVTAFISDSWGGRVSDKHTYNH